MDNKVISVQFGNRAKEKSNLPLGAQPSTQTSAIQTNLAPESEMAEVPSSDLRTLAERNRSNQERIRKERDLANKAVLKSYRIK
jgi:hypothetical protein